MVEDLGNGVELEMAFIQSGIFNMGSEIFITSLETPQHEVSVKSFFMGKYPITQLQWRAIASRMDLKVEHELEINPSCSKGDSKPVEQVSWYDAVEFCARLSKLTSRGYRLPSEAEWEYACRAGTKTPFHFGDEAVGGLANCVHRNKSFNEYRQKTTPVGQFPPNSFGLYDMHGNVWEWCLDNWHDDYEGAPTDGSTWSNPEFPAHVLRGGSWYDHPTICRSSSRIWGWGDSKKNVFGFRVASDLSN